MTQSQHLYNFIIMPNIVNLLLCCLSAISTVEVVLLHFSHFYVNVKAPQVQVPAHQNDQK